MRLFSTWAAASAIADPLVWTEASILQAVAQAECRVLATPLDDLLGRLTALGSQRILVANPVGTLAQAGRFSWASPQGHIGHLHARDVDIDLDLQSAATVLATGVGRRSVLPLGVRVYNSAGDLLLSLTPDSHIGSQAFHEVVRAHFIKVSERPSPPSTTAHPQRSRTTHLAVDIDGAMVAWSRSSTHHSLDAILEQHGVSRQQFYNTVPGAVASPIEADQMLALLRWTVSKRAPMLLQVGRAGAATVTRLFPTAVETT
ncbi:MAG: hypothetical protein CL927_03890, partial [Deltaproteobacteria bacterium]|nr:hypothetical protein [Deltaproteobacteria bacterium]